MLQIRVFLQTKSQIVDALRGQLINTEFFFVVEIPPLQLAVRSSLGLVDCLFEVQIGRMVIVRYQSLVVDLNH